MVRMPVMMGDEVLKVMMKKDGDRLFVLLSSVTVSCSLVEKVIKVPGTNSDYSVTEGVRQVLRYQHILSTGQLSLRVWCQEGFVKHTITLHFTNKTTMLMPARIRLFTRHFTSLLPPPTPPSYSSSSLLSFTTSISHHVSATKTPKIILSDTAKSVRPVLFFPPGTDPEQVTDDMILPFSNIVLGPYAGDAKVKQVEFIGSSIRPKDCPKDDRPEFAMLGRSNVGKSSLINSLVRKKEVALTSKKPGKTQLINHFLVNKSWYLVDLPGYGFANAPEATRMDWSVFTKGYFLNRESLVSVLLLVDASVPPQKIDLDCANWLGRNNIPMTIVFTKCDKMKNTKGKRPDENIKNFQDLIKENYKVHPPWIMTSSATGLGRDDLLLHMSQLRNFWDN
ncbi:GTP-binding protein At2g22870 [Rutidosis leptorrhynchoides]|uniref:GTP-binding protein At2g22870 n=1 Tax=Rutidosis leptorrhynchoides TaxID=125765 RepID=UPI003A9A32F8